MARGRLVTVRGSVISNRMQKTIVVQSTEKVKHPLYGKYVVRTTRYYAHDENGEAAPGDFVELASVRPISKLKRWRLLRVVNRATGAADPAIGRQGGQEGES
ncbi:MAG: 30S ribosomal protein S17 [Planctomycetes bacterium]|jgi:small subunit ribosomal protein S17|nr:30S ribosomal protein S17 [Planctomycetota bacterium]